MTNIIAKGGTVVFFVGVILYGSFWFYNRMSQVAIESYLCHNVSESLEVSAAANWLDLNLAQLPGFVGKFKSQAAQTQAAGDGTWTFTIKDKNNSDDLVLSGYINSLGYMLGAALQSRNYTRESINRPAPIVITQFIIKEPGGRTWTISDEGSASLMLCNLGTALSLTPANVDLSPLMKTPRGSLAYAVFFTAVVGNRSLDWKIEKSCDPDAAVRTFAAESLATQILSSATNDKKCGGFDPQRYESLLEQLAQATSIAEKNKLYEKLLAEEKGKYAKILAEEKKIFESKKAESKEESFDE